MINYDSIISVFNEKGTLLKWLKKVEKALKESVLTNVEVLHGQGNSFAFKFTFQDNTSITTDYITIEPDINATLLHNLINGSDTVVVDLNELQNKLIIKLNEEYKKTLITQTDIQNLESELTTKQNNIVNSEEIVKHSGEDNKLYLNNTISNKINNSMQLPASAPTSTELVGIDANKAQVNIGVGEGLSIENGTLKATGGGITQKILWENPNPNVTFGEQDIIINDNLNDYNLLLFTQKVSTSDNNYFTGITNISNFKTLGSLMMHAEYYNKWGRGYNYINETTIHASTGQYNAEGNNNYGIPINIIGYKF